MVRTMSWIVWPLYWVGLLLSVLSLVLVYKGQNLWCAVAIAVIFWGGALMGLVLQKFAQSS